jgi:hypothetical protein
VAGDRSADELVHGHPLQQRPRVAGAPHCRAAEAGGDGSLGRRGHAVEDVEEAVLVAGERDGARRRGEAVLLLRLPEQPPERRVVQVRQPQHEPPRRPVAAVHAHSHVPRRHRVRPLHQRRRPGGRGAGAPPAHGAPEPDERRDRDYDLAHA